MINNMDCAIFVVNILSMMKWKATILSLGVKAVAQFSITVRCFVNPAMQRKLTSIE